MNIKSLLFAAFTLLALCSQAQTQVNVKVRQDYVLVEQKDHAFSLKKKPFQLLFHVKNNDAFLISFTQDADLYRSAIGKADLEVSWFENTGMAEGLFNEEKTILLSDEAPSYWYFTDLQDHRFDKHPQGRPVEWTATRTVTQVYQVESESAIPVKDLQKPLYFVIYQTEVDEELNIIGQEILNHGVLNWQN